MPIQSNRSRATEMPIWKCSYCHKHYQTKGQALAHEEKKHHKQIE